MPSTRGSLISRYQKVKLGITYACSESARYARCFLHRLRGIASQGQRRPGDCGQVEQEEAGEREEGAGPVAEPAEGDGPGRRCLRVGHSGRGEGRPQAEGSFLLAFDPLV